MNTFAISKLYSVENEKSCNTCAANLNINLHCFKCRVHSSILSPSPVYGRSLAKHPARIKQTRDKCALIVTKCNHLGESLSSGVTAGRILKVVIYFKPIIKLLGWGNILIKLKIGCLIKVHHTAAFCGPKRKSVSVCCVCLHMLIPQLRTDCECFKKIIDYRAQRQISWQLDLHLWMDCSALPAPLWMSARGLIFSINNQGNGFIYVRSGAFVW